MEPGWIKQTALAAMVLGWLVGCGESELKASATESVAVVQEVNNIAGNDDNNNGIRDDVESWIIAEAGENNAVRSALGALAIAHQRLILTEPDQPHNANNAHSLYQLAVGCLFYQQDHENGPEAFGLINGVKEKMLDNSTRQAAYDAGYAQVQQKHFEVSSGSGERRSCQRLHKAVEV